MEAIARLQPWSKDVEVLLLERDAGGNRGRSIAKPVTMETVPDHALISEPTFTLKPKEAQQLMDDLWQCGYRPSEGAGSAGSLKATQYHLEDMRRLVFKGE